MGYIVARSADNAGGSSTPAVRNPIVGLPNGQQPYVHVRDITEGWTLYEKNPDVASEYPASCCKLMTLLLAWEYHQSDWTSNVTVTTADVTQPSGYTTDMAGLANGDVVSWEELAYCLLLPSGADACQCMARIIGNEIYAAAGNTGSSGMDRFVERMNARAAELGMTNTIFVTPFGGSRVSDVVRSKMSARDLSTICEEVFQYSALRAIATTVSHGVTITGGRTATLTVTNYNKFINGPIFNPAGVKDTTILAGKDGVWTDGDGPHASYNKTVIWQAPNGNEIIITVLGSLSDKCLLWDCQGIIAQAVRDFSYLLEGTTAGTDSNWADVEFLICADDNGVIQDVGPSPKTLTKTSVYSGDGLCADADRGIFLERSDQQLSVPDSANISNVSGSFTYECWIATTAPGGIEILPGYKGDPGREWTFNIFSNASRVFTSTDGVNWTNNTAMTTYGGNEQGVLLNGAPRHFALVKNGSTWSLYINGHKCQNTVTLSQPGNATGPLWIGYLSKGQMDEIRYTKVARYTAALFNIVCRRFPRS